MSKGKDNQEQTYHASTTWFHVFHDMIKNRDMAKIEGSTIKVYLVVKAHVELSTGNCFPEIKEIAEEAGLSERQVTRCLKELEKYEYISKVRVGNKYSYTLREKISIKDSDGNSQAVATWNYVPGGVKGAVAELKEAVISGQLVGGKIIHIEQLILNIQNIDSGGTGNIINTKQIDRPIDSREKIQSLHEALKPKHDKQIKD